MASGPITSWEIDGETVETVLDFILEGSKITANGDCSHEIKRRLLLGRKVMTNLDSIFKSIDIILPTNVGLVKAMVFPVVMLWMWKLDCEESWVLKKWCFWTVVLEKTLESPLDYKEIQPVHSEGDQSWVFIGRADVKAETPIVWPPHAKSWLIGKDSDARRDWGQEEKGMTEDEMAGWHHWLDGRAFEWTLGVGDGQGGLACCNSWGRKESDMTEQLNWTDTIYWSYLVVQKVKNLPAMRETWIWPLDWEHALEEGMAFHSSILAWIIPMDRGASQATVHWVTKSWTCLSD